MSEVPITLLEQAFQRILSKLKSEGVTTVRITNDAYRFVPTDSWNDFTTDEILVGSIQDDVEGLKKLVDDPDRFCTYVDVDRFATVLKALSQELNPPTNA